MLGRGAFGTYALALSILTIHLVQRWQVRRLTGIETSASLRALVTEARTLRRGDPAST